MVSESLEEKEAETKKIVKEGNNFEGGITPKKHRENAMEKLNTGNLQKTFFLYLQKTLCRRFGEYIIPQLLT